ncbi:hypothetical protein SUGI_0648800 [Cryptomeria japonica]|nr:hypothetical protein SUGI_0648800 [Cryptomeria japonica]
MNKLEEINIKIVYNHVNKNKEETQPYIKLHHFSRVKHNKLVATALNDEFPDYSSHGDSASFLVLFDPCPWFTLILLPMEKMEEDKTSSSPWTSEFMPERVLEGDNSKMEYGGQNFELIPFGAGRRICPGR